MLDPSVTAFNKRLKSVSQSPSGRQVLHFTDGTTHETDLVIGADGIRSTSRIAVVGEGNNNLGFSNTHAYRGLVPVDTLLAAGVNPDKIYRPLIWAGVAKVRFLSAHLHKYSLTNPGIKHIVSFPMNNDKIVRTLRLLQYPYHMLKVDSSSTLLRFTDQSMTIISRKSAHTLGLRRCLIRTCSTRTKNGATTLESSWNI